MPSLFGTGIDDVDDDDTPFESPETLEEWADEMIRAEEERMLYKKLLALEGIQRWNHHPRQRQQSVAAHGFNVAVITAVLCKALGCDEQEIKDRTYEALWHDFPESVTGDVSPLVKRKVDWIKIDDLAASEAAQISTKGDLNLLDELHTDLAMSPIVKLADALDAWLFAHMEVKMGNFLFQDIRDELTMVVRKQLALVYTDIGMQDGYAVLSSLFAYDFQFTVIKRIGPEMSHV